MLTTLETIVLGLLLVVLLSYRRRFRAPLSIRYLLLTMWYPEPMLTCNSYSTTRPLSFTWMTCVSRPAEEEVRRLRRQVHREHQHQRRRQQRHQPAHRALPADPRAGSRPARIQRTSCVMGSPRRPPTSMCLVGCLTARRCPTSIEWTSQPESGNRAHQCRSPVKHPPVR